MKIDIAQAVKSEGEAFSKQYRGEFAAIEFLGETYEFPGGTSVECEWRYDGEGVIVTGRFDADLKARCARCAEESVYTLGFDFAEYYKKQPEEGMYAYNGETIDLSQMLEDNVVINLPPRMLCDEGCEWLCSRCGKSLNEGACSCTPLEEKNSPFSKLAELYDDEEV